MNSLANGKLTEQSIKQHLTEAVDANVNAAIGVDEDETGGKSKSKKDDSDKQQLYLVPLYDDPNKLQKVIQHPLFDFFPMNMTS